jgi:plastocyanin
LCDADFLRNINEVTSRLDSPRSAAARIVRAVPPFAFAICFAIATTAHTAPVKQRGGFFMPSADAAKIVTVNPTGEAAAGITVLTLAVAVKEHGPKATVAKFGEVYAFSPEFIAVHRDEPTQIEFWNLQPDDEHDFALLGPDLNVMMYQKLPPLKKTSWVFTFHREGVFVFKCLVHQPAMSGQFLVLPPVAH